MFIDSIRDAISFARFQRRWRNKNPQNSTIARSRFKIESVSVGSHTYGELNIVDYGESARLRIGSYCSIAVGVTFLLNAEHRMDFISTFPFRVKRFGDRFEATSRGDIIVGSDVWFGQNATICSGVTIGQGSVVAAGSVVTKSIEPYSVVGGVPARLIRKRFTDSIVARLMCVDLHRLLNAVKISSSYLVTTPLTEENITAILERFGELEEDVSGDYTKFRKSGE